ncbi:amidase family protein [Pleomorphomonas koreensis]|uniref:amidase family protein n=1 Tax=Pleomorphomonas koreensis TaxID=257440 RepID=UPI00047A813F|nr:amidase family protein [Pleomorphomonas koreensis]
MSAPVLTLEDLRRRFARHPDAVLDLADDLAARLAASGDAVVAAPLRAAAGHLLARCPDPTALPLWGAPCIVGANIDVAGLATSAGLPAIDFLADFDAVAIERLRAAGALIVGKAAVDPLGLDASAGAAAEAVAAGLAVFAIASDRTGAASLDAAGRGVVAVKPTPGRVGTDGLFGTAPGIDGITILAADVASAVAVRRAIEDAERRPMPAPARLGLIGNDAAGHAVADRLGLVPLTIDAAPFVEIAALTDGDVWLSPRLDDVEAIFIEMPELFPSALRPRLSRALDCPARELAGAQHRLARLKQAVETVFATVDLLLVPAGSAPAGFVNACGLAAVALPDGMALVGPGGSDDRLADAAAILAEMCIAPPVDIATAWPLARP